MQSTSNMSSDKDVVAAQHENAVNTKRGRKRRHCKRFWWIYLIVFVVVVVVLVIVL